MTRLASALTITAAASRKLMLGVVVSGTTLDAPAGTARGWGEGPPVGRILSVSCRMSLTFFSSVAQNLLSEVLRTVVLELLRPPSRLRRRPLRRRQSRRRSRFARRRQRSPWSALHIEVIDPVSVQIRGVRHDDQVRAVQFPAHVDCFGIRDRSCGKVCSIALSVTVPVIPG